MELIRKGAEANILLEKRNGEKIVLKNRIQKKYRVPQLDFVIRDTRTKGETKLITDARRAGVPTPIIFEIDRKNTTIVMQYIEGERLRELLEKLPDNQRAEICEKVGQQIGKLHNSKIIHGDLTTSNMIYSRDCIYFIDFGLGYYSLDIEDQGVDLLLLKRAFLSTHYKFADQAFEAVLRGYRKVLGRRAEAVINRTKEIEARARYVVERVTR
ncbi:MAG: KEOPS complex kinase/ATPase Bud32 [Euryarchaeota archaeon]|nr:KEOPS complex kinase/ATPase Bud32 [Euryarchaeota archaeon]